MTRIDMKKLFALILCLVTSGVAHAGIISTRSTAPTACAVGDVWINPGAATNDRIYTCTATNTWTKNSGRPWVIQSTAPSDLSLIWFDDNQVPGYLVLKLHNGTTWVQQAIGEGGTFNQAGDYTLTGSWDFTGATVTGISGGSMVYPGAGISISTGSAWGTSITPGTSVATALAAPVDGTGGLVSKAYVDAFPNIIFGTGIAVAEDTPSAGTDTVSIDADATPTDGSAKPITSNAAFDALAGKQDADADLTTAAGATGAGNSKYFGTNSSGTAGFYDLPSGSGSFAFDTFPTYEDSSHSSGIAVNGTTLAVYSSTAGKWLTVGLTDTLDATPIDTTPDAFSFTDITDAALSTEYTALAQINGIAAGITCSGSGGTVAACTGSTEGTCGTFGATSGSITNGQYVGAKVNSSGTASTPVNNIVTCGGVSDTFTTTTASGPVVLAKNTVNDYTISLVPLTNPSYIAVQSFQVTQSGNADSIALWIANTGTSANLVVRIGTTNDMSTTYLASGSKNLTSWVEGEQIVSLDSSVTLTEGTTYYVAVYASTGNDVILKGSSTSAYSYNFYYTTTGWPAASSRSDIDMYFQIGTNL